MVDCLCTHENVILAFILQSNVILLITRYNEPINDDRKDDPHTSISSLIHSVHILLMKSGLVAQCLTWPAIWPSLSPCTVINPILLTYLRDLHYTDVIMGTIASQITSLTIVYSTVYSDADQRKYQSSASLAFVRGIHWRPVNSPHKWLVTRKMFLPFDDVIMDISDTTTWKEISLSLDIDFIQNHDISVVDEYKMQMLIY